MKVPELNLLILEKRGYFLISLGLEHLDSMLERAVVSKRTRKEEL